MGGAASSLSPTQQASDAKPRQVLVASHRKDFQTAASFSLAADSSQALMEALEQITSTFAANGVTPRVDNPDGSGGGEGGHTTHSESHLPSFMIVWCTTDHNTETIVAALKTMCPGVPFIGGTHSTGLFTQTGWNGHPDGSHSLGIFAIKDPGGYYVVGQAPLGTKSVGTFSPEAPALAKAAGAKVMKECLKKAPQEKGMPNGIWMLGEMDSEEGVLEGISDILVSASVRPCAICGGSSGNGDAHNGQQFTSECGAMKNSVALALMYCTANIMGDFENAYKTITRSGIVTEAHNRQLKKIDGRPAADVFNEWNNNKFAEAKVGESILQPVGMCPLGRIKMYSQEGDPQYLLVTPFAITEDRGLHVLARVNKGDKIFQVSAADTKSVANNLVATITKPATDHKRTELHGVVGAFCTCYTVFDSYFNMAGHKLSEAYKGTPFLMANTFGEQGTFHKVPGLYAHGNLMVSSLTFVGKRKLTDPLQIPSYPPTTGLVAFALVSCPDGPAIREDNPEAYKRANVIMTHWIQQCVPNFRGFICDQEAHRGLLKIPLSSMCFLIATPSVLEAIQFCRAVQTLTMGLNWPEDVLRMAECKAVPGKSGKMMFRGPRFSVSAHVGRPEFKFDATRGTVVYNGAVLSELSQLHQCVVPGHTIVTEVLSTAAENTCSSYYGKKVSLEKSLTNVTVNKTPKMLEPPPFPCFEITDNHLLERDTIEEEVDQ